MRELEEIIKDLDETEKRCDKLFAQYNEKREHSYGELTWIEMSLNVEQKHLSELSEEMKQARIKVVKDTIADALQSKINAAYGVEP